MQDRDFVPHGRKTLFGVLYAMVVAPSFATQPLVDQYSDGARSGHIFPVECCYVELPSNDRIRAMRRAEMPNCSAIGGPVGVFRLEAGKLWLTSLYKCSGTVALNDIYPGMNAPAPATWLTGTFKTVLDIKCHDAGMRPIHGATQTLIVEKGVVKSLKETPGDLTACAQ